MVWLAHVIYKITYRSAYSISGGSPYADTLQGVGGDLDSDINLHNVSAYMDWYVEDHAREPAGRVTGEAG